MNPKDILVYIAKLLVSGVIFFVGIVLGGMIATLLQLPAPALPQGLDPESAGRNLMLTTPLLALAPALLARGLGGGYWTRASVLSFLIWIAYTVNTQLEASIFSTFATGIAYSIVVFAVPSILCGMAVAWLFPADKITATSLGYWQLRSRADWAWRLILSAVAFMPVYWFFGMLVVPFTAEYYRQSQFGLSMPSVEQILTILFIRSVLFLLACLPVIVLWRQSNGALFWRLGAALFILVGLVYMLAADWMPVTVRFPHTIEILADEFVYAGILAFLLGRPKTIRQIEPSVVQQHAPS